MKRKGEASTVARLGGIVFILFIVVLLLTAGPSKIWAGAKEIFGFTDTLLDVTQLNEEARESFSTDFAQTIDVCIKNKDAQCGCTIPLASFRQDHTLYVYSDRIDLQFEPEKSSLKAATSLNLPAEQRSSFANLNCYFGRNGKIQESLVKIAFDEKGAYLSPEKVDSAAIRVTDTLRGRDSRADYGLFETFQLYKSSQGTCWMTDGFDRAEFNQLRLCGEAVKPVLGEGCIQDEKDPTLFTCKGLEEGKIVALVGTDIAFRVNLFEFGDLAKTTFTQARIDVQSRKGDRPFDCNDNSFSSYLVLASGKEFSTCSDIPALQVKFQDYKDKKLAILVHYDVSLKPKPIQVIS